MTLKFYDWEGNRIGIGQYAELKQTKFRVASDSNDSVRISTVWLGLDHRFGEDGPPLIFESMVFPQGSYEEIVCRRYATEEEARRGHADLVAEYLTDAPDVPDWT